MAERQEGDGGFLIGNRYHVLPQQLRSGYAGLFSCVATQSTEPVPNPRATSETAPGLVAVRMRRDAPPSANLNHFLNAHGTTLLMPLAHGPGGNDYWVVCDAPPGPSLLERPIAGAVSEAELINVFMRPLATALARLHSVGLTHRGVRPGNLYRSETGRVLLGPGCLGPLAYDQPALYEPAASGLCAPWCRGAGTSADDVYALGVVLLELALGRPLLPGLSDEQIIQRKLEQSSPQLLIAPERLSPGLVSMLRSMLSDDPLARPALALLAEHGIGAERPKLPRPDSRAPRPLMLGRLPIFTARMLAQGFASQPVEALAFLRAGTVDQWLRRALEQPLIAVRIEEALRSERNHSIEGSDATILMQVIAMLDPLAPMFWDGTWFWPDAVPTMLAQKMTRMMVQPMADGPPALADMLQQRAIRRWMFLSNRAVPAVVEEVERRFARCARLPLPAMRMPALGYALNPFLACVSPGLTDACVLGADQLLHALEAQVGNHGTAGARLLDTEMLSLLAARADQAGETPPVAVDSDQRLLDLHLLAAAQAAIRRRDRETGSEAAPLQLPGLARHLLPAARDRLKSWPGKGRRARRLERLDQVAEAGDLVAMLGIIDQNDARNADEAALREARGEAEALRAAHRANEAAGAHRAEVARGTARDLAVAAGVFGLLGVLLMNILT